MSAMSLISSDSPDTDELATLAPNIIEAMILCFNIYTSFSKVT